MRPDQSLGGFVPPISGHDHLQGDRDAPILLIQYGDYQNPGCRVIYSLAQQLQACLKVRFGYVFRHFPLVHHAHAQNAAEAAEAAASQGKFWEMHALLFKCQDHLDDAHLVECAVEVKLDISQFLQEIAAHKHRDRIAADVQGGQAGGISELPAFFITNIRYQGNHSIRGLRDLLAEFQ